MPHYKIFDFQTFYHVSLSQHMLGAETGIGMTGWKKFHTRNSRPDSDSRRKTSGINFCKEEFLLW